MSTPMPSSRRARACRRRSASISAVRCSITIAGCPRAVPTGPTRRASAGASLRNTCLDLLVATRRPDAIALAARQYQAADNMTDRMAALSTLSLADVPERAAALDDFYARYAGDPLIVDKWFTLQATIPEPATLDRVKALTTHPAFSFANPNRVRALIHSFALGEPEGVQPRRRRRLRLHRRHGAGARSEKSAARGAAVVRAQELARARADAARAGGGRLAARRRRACAVARCRRHRPARARQGLTRIGPASPGRGKTSADLVSVPHLLALRGAGHERAFRRAAPKSLADQRASVDSQNLQIR